MQYHVTYPEPKSDRKRIIPVFLPFAGCPGRCIFCSQNAQTNTPSRPLSAILDSMVRQLESLDAENKRTGQFRVFDLGLYGGTFTALDRSWQNAFLRAAMGFADKGLIRHIRCSTRPDCVSPRLLTELSALGLRMVELGIQSFDNCALMTSGRGYSGKTAIEACTMVHSAGLELGIQLMPGLPGVSQGIFRADIRTVCELSVPVQTLRLYPCLVLEGTKLAQLWRAGRYAPWDMQTSVEELADACLRIWEKNIRIIRLGVKEEDNLARVVLAGPRHPAFGDMVRGTALKKWLLDTFKRLSPQGEPLALLSVPRRLQGTFWGHGGMFREEYAACGIGPSSVRFHDAPEFEFLFGLE